MFSFFYSSDMNKRTGQTSIATTEWTHFLRRKTERSFRTTNERTKRIFYIKWTELTFYAGPNDFDFLNERTMNR